jgi:hypothetical protein
MTPSCCSASRSRSISAGVRRSCDITRHRTHDRLRKARPRRVTLLAAVESAGGGVRPRASGGWCDLSGIWTPACRTAPAVPVCHT